MSRGWIGALFVVVASAALSGCASDIEARNDQLSRENAELARQAEDLRSQRAAEAARSEAKAAEIRALERERAEAIARIEEWKGKAEQGTPAISAAMQQDLDQIQKAGFERPTVNAAGDIAIPLACDFSFALGSDELNDAGRRVLRTLAEKLNGEYASYMIRVEGHTDNLPVVREATKAKFHDNMGLSMARATTVARFLQDELHVDPTRLVTAGRGSQAPVADNGTAAGRAKNRRVEIMIVTSVQSK